LSERWLKKDNF